MILVVDDDPADLEIARKVLNQDRQVILASDSKRAFELARNLGFSVAIVYLNFRGKEGIELIRKLHQHVPGLPIVAICGDVQGRLLQSLKDSGVVEILSKPVTPEWKPIVERIRPKRSRA